MYILYVSSYIIIIHTLLYIWNSGKNGRCYPNQLDKSTWISEQLVWSFWLASLRFLETVSTWMMKLRSFLRCPPLKDPWDRNQIAWWKQHTTTWVFSPRHSPVSGEHIGRHRLVSSTVGLGDSPTIKIDGSKRETATATTLRCVFLLKKRELALRSLLLYNGICLWFKCQIIYQADFLGVYDNPVLWTSISYHLHMLSPVLRSLRSFPNDQSDQVFSSQADVETNGIVAQWKGIQTKYKPLYRVRELVQESSIKNLQIWVVVTLQLLVMKTLIFASDFFPSDWNFIIATFWFHNFWEQKTHIFLV